MIILAPCCSKPETRSSQLNVGVFMFYDIAVVGFGLAGRLAALELSKQHRITVFEADDEHTQIMMDLNSLTL